MRLINWMPITLCLSAVFGINVYSAAIVKQTVVSNDVEQFVDKIRKQYAEINAKISTYNKVEKEVYDESSEGGLLTAFYDKKKLTKITGTYYGETGKTFVEYYFDEGDFFFVYSKESSYVKPLYMDHGGKIRDVKEDRYYFNGGVLLRWLSGNKSIPVNTVEFVEKNNVFREVFKKYKRMFVE